MKKMVIVLLLLVSYSAYPQGDRMWGSWSKLIGSWKGEGSGTLGAGSGGFTFAFDLDQNVIVRKSITEFPASDGKARIHKDLMVIYAGQGGAPDRAIYFDNEGHTI